MFNILYNAYLILSCNKIKKIVIGENIDNIKIDKNKSLILIKIIIEVCSCTGKVFKH